jgi:hypothetical protein
VANLSVYSRNQLVDWMSGVADMAASGTVYLALYDGDPSGAGSDVTDTVATGGRIALTGMSTSSGGAKSATNSADLVFTTSAIGNATVTYVAGFDAQGDGAGNMRWYKQIASNSISTGNPVKILANGLTLTSDADLSSYSGDYVVNWMSGEADFPATGTRYMGLWLDNPQGGGSPTEVTSTIRVAGRLAFTTNMGSASGGSATNATLINFGNAAGGATVGYTACHDAATAGNLICSDVVTGGAQTVTAGNPVSVPASSLVITAA